MLPVGKGGATLSLVWQDLPLPLIAVRHRFRTTWIISQSRIYHHSQLPHSPMQQVKPDVMFPPWKRGRCES